MLLDLALLNLVIKLRCFSGNLVELLLVLTLFVFELFNLTTDGFHEGFEFLFLSLLLGSSLRKLLEGLFVVFFLLVVLTDDIVLL